MSSEQVKIETFVREWNLFLQNLRVVGHQVLSHPNRNPIYMERLGPLLEDVIMELGSDLINESIRAAVAASQYDRDDKTLDYLTRELQFFNALANVPTTVRRNEANRPGSERTNQSKDATEEDVLGAGKTIKDSIEKWLKKRLPGRVKNLFATLNELLSLIKGG